MNDLISVIVCTVALLLALLIAAAFVWQSAKMQSRGLFIATIIEAIALGFTIFMLWRLLLVGGAA